MPTKLPRFVAALAFTAAFSASSDGAETSLSSNAAASAPLLSILDRFSAPDVPPRAASEVEGRPGRWTNAPAAPAGLPGKGLAQHSMLYLGEGYNKLFVVQNGRVIWTFSTGKGGELDDAWMLSNGNILFSRMRYV